jgi:hypothetical protein
MSAIDNQPTNINFLGQNGFRFAIRRLPGVNYFCQSVTLPSVSMVAIESPTPLAFVPRPGDRITYDPLTIRFKVDEDLRNYFEIQSWIEGLGHPESLKQTTDLSKQIRSEVPMYRGVGTAMTFVSDGVLSILSSNKNLNKNVFFYDLFPISLTELTFDTTNTTLEYLEATATFRYRRYVLET